MKNVFFALVFMLVGTFTFANTNDNVVNYTNLITSNVIGDNLTYDNFSFSFNENQLSHEELIALADCTLKGKFTITFPDGEKFTWEGTLTIVGQSCVEFLKDLMK